MALIVDAEVNFSSMGAMSNMRKWTQRYSISLVARCFGLRVSALRYYGRGELRRLALVQRLHQQGLVSLADTATLLANAPACTPPTWHDVLGTSAEALRARIEDLRAAHDTLQHLLECPDPDPIRQCPYLREQLDDAVDTALAQDAADA